MLFRSRAVLVHEALQQTPGIERVASFGPVLDSDFDPNTSAAEGLGGRYPAVEIYAVAEPGSAPTADRREPSGAGVPIPVSAGSELWPRVLGRELD